MGNELQCSVRFGKQQSEGKALLETNELSFRGQFRLKIPRQKIQSAKVVKGALHIVSDQGEAVFELGAAAEKWCNKILHPKSRLEKLGVKAESKIALAGIGCADGNFVSELKKQTKDFTESGLPDAEIIFYFAATRKDLKQLAKLAKTLRASAALWIVYPKGQLEITELDVLAAGRGTGLKDVKVVGFSVTHTALKFVIPLSQR
jgi:hypothetical protein